MSSISTTLNSTENSNNTGTTLPTVVMHTSSSTASSSSSSVIHPHPPQPSHIPSVVPNHNDNHNNSAVSLSSSSSQSPWITQISRKTGKPYWFNTKTNVSVWEEPSELRTPYIPSTANTNTTTTTAMLSSSSSLSNTTANVNSSGVPLQSSATHSSAVEISSSSTLSSSLSLLLDPLTFRTANYEFYQAKENIPLCRTAIEKICQQLVDGKDTIPGAIGYHRFPPTESKALKFIIYEMADEYELKCETVGKEGINKHIVIFRNQCDPTDVLQLQQEEKALQEEAELRKQQEIQSEAMAVARQALQRLEASRDNYYEKEHGTTPASSSSLSSENASKHHPTSASILPNLGEMVEVVPLFKKKDKRSISEIQAEIKLKKHKV